MTTTHDLIQALRCAPITKNDDAGKVIGEIYLIADLLKEIDRRIDGVLGNVAAFDHDTQHSGPTFGRICDETDTETFRRQLIDYADGWETLDDDVSRDYAPLVGGHHERGSVG